MKTFEFNWAPVEGAVSYRLLEQLEEGQGYKSLTEEPLSADTTSHSMEVFVPEKAYATYMLESCDAKNECIETEAIGIEEGLISATGRIDSEVIGDEIGESAIFFSDGDLLAVGNCNRNQNLYHVRIFSQNQEWAQESEIFRDFRYHPSCVAQLAVSSSGDTLATSSFFHHSDTVGVDNSVEGGDENNNGATYSGAAFVHVRRQDGWVQQAYIKASNTERSDLFGISMALSGDGNTLLVGAEKEDGASSGLNGDEASNTLEDSGAVYHFVRNDGKWTQKNYIKAPQAFAEAHFGLSLALSPDGSTLAIGADFDKADNVEGDATGSVFILAPSGDSWEYRQTLKASNQHSAAFGRALALSADGKTLAVGSPLEDGIDSGVDGDQSTDGNNNIGAVYVFIERDGNWEQQAYIKASNPDANDHFGSRLSLSADGSTLVVGTIKEESAAAGINGNQSDNSLSEAGAAYLFTRDENNNWRQRTYLKSTAPHDEERYARGLALDPDGKTLVVGAPLRGKYNSGSVYIY